MAWLSDDCEWKVVLAVDGLVVAPSETTEIVDAARRRLLGGLGPGRVRDRPAASGWQAAGSRLLEAYASRRRASLPALGPLDRRRRLREVLAALVGKLLQEADGAAGARDVVTDVDLGRRAIAPL